MNNKGREIISRAVNGVMYSPHPNGEEHVRYFRLRGLSSIPESVLNHLDEAGLMETPGIISPDIPVDTPILRIIGLTTDGILFEDIHVPKR